MRIHLNNKSQRVYRTRGDRHRNEIILALKLGGEAALNVLVRDIRGHEFGAYPLSGIANLSNKMELIKQ